MGYSPRGQKELDRTEQLTLSLSQETSVPYCITWTCWTLARDCELLEGGGWICCLLRAQADHPSTEATSGSVFLWGDCMLPPAFPGGL